MLEFFKSLKRFSIATMIVAAVVGVLFIAFPAQCIKYTALVVGISLIVTGLISIFAYIIQRDTAIPLVLGIIVAIFGIIICIKYKAIIDIIIVLFGVFILTSGIVDFVTSIRSLMFHRKSGWLTILLSIITIVFGIVAITKSGALSESIVQFMGVALLIYSVLDLITLIQITNVKRAVKKEAQKSSDIQIDSHEV